MQQQQQGWAQQHWSARLRIAGRYNRGDFSSRTHFTCPRAPLLVLEAKGRYVGTSPRYDDGEEGDLVELDSACSITMTITLCARQIE